MQPLIAQLSVPQVCFLATLLIWRVMEVRVDIMTRKRLRAGAQRQDGGSLVVLYVLLIGGILFCTLLAFEVSATTIMSAPIVFFWLGIVLMNTGIVLRFYAIRVLGAFFTTTVAVAPNQRVIESGPYRFIRHPSYSGLLITLMGYGLCMTNWLSLLVLLGCALMGLSYRIHVEEHVLQVQLGEPYQDYMRRTKRLIPFVF